MAREPLTPGRDRRKRPQAPCAHHGLLPTLPEGELLEGVALVAKVVSEDGSYAFRLWKSPGMNEHEAAWWLRLHADKLMKPLDDYADWTLSATDVQITDEDQAP